MVALLAMLPLLILCIITSSISSASPLARRSVDNTQAAGTNPLSVSSVQYLGEQTSNNSCVHRDLGFTGRIGDNWYAVYGDTTYCATGVEDAASDNSADFNGMVRDSVAQMTGNVLEVHDLNLNTDSPVAHPHQFIPFNESWGEDQSYGFGGTSICFIDDTNAVVYYVVNANEAGLKGAGMAKVQLIDGTPTVTERLGENGIWWDAASQPRYGDAAAYRDLQSDYIYAIGGAPESQTGYTDQSYAYQARVNACDAYDLSKYEYWHGRSLGWSTTPLTTFDSESAVMWGVGQGQVVWNAHYSCYIFVHTTPGGNQVALRTSQSPEGPWSGDIIIYSPTISAGGQVYAGVAHPYLDESGQTLTISYTNLPNNIEAIKVTFE